MGDVLWGDISDALARLFSGGQNPQHDPDGAIHVRWTVAEPTFGNTEYGFFYGPNIVDQWTEDRGSYVELYWNVSTWNPYQVVLMKSRINK